MIWTPFAFATYKISLARWGKISASPLEIGLAKSAYSLGDTFGNDSNGLDLWVLHELHGGAVNTPGGGKVDNSIDLVMLGHGLVH